MGAVIVENGRRGVHGCENSSVALRRQGATRAIRRTLTRNRHESMDFVWIRGSSYFSIRISNLGHL